MKTIMFKVQLFFPILPKAWLALLAVLITTKSIPTTNTASNAKPGCPTQCGNITVPYPFGIGLDGSCSIGHWYSINCNTSYDPHKAFLEHTNLEILDFSVANPEIWVNMYMSSRCYEKGELLIVNHFDTWMNLVTLPLIISDTANRFTLIGCDNYGIITGMYGVDEYSGGVISMCDGPEYVGNGSCYGRGCAQTTIPKGSKGFNIELGRVNTTNVSDFNNCSYAFLGEYNKYTFEYTDLSDPGFMNRTMENVRIVLEWTVGGNQTCLQAQKNVSSYACKENSFCTDFNVSTEGYRCSCQNGYEGNPYLGCTDIDECASPNNPCSHLCMNVPGSYKCSCRKGFGGDGNKNGSGCARQGSIFATQISIGLIVGIVLLLAVITWVYIMVKRNKHLKMREKFFEQNGGLLLKQQMSSQGDKNIGQESSSKIFSADELRVATNNYSEDRILGRGGYGMVYKGILKNRLEVAIKKSKFVDQTQIEQFINEVVIVTQINHRNVVRLLGCCLETEVPLLVYEYVSNGTVYEHIHRKVSTSWLNWAGCVRIASEAADAFAYLHSEASIPIIHRDVKSANILLDKSNTAKVADFGASRLIPIGRSEVTTLVQGTIGYLDPEYLLTSQLTDKSDVYSFGVVLAELLTKDRPVSSEGNLSIYFLLAMQEGRLLEIIDPQLLQEASEEQAFSMANLIKKCLSIKGEDRPTMKEVARELEGLRQQIKNLLGDKNEHTRNLIKDYSANTMEFSEQYSAQMEMMMEMNHPR